MDRGFERVAEIRKQNIYDGGFNYFPEDRVYLERANNVEEFNRIMAKHHNVYAIFIYAHSYDVGRYGESGGFTFSKKFRGAKYNVAITRGRNETHVTKLRVPDMAEDGFVHLYSCNAIGDIGYDIVSNLANHFGVPVYANQTGTSLWPPGPLPWKKTDVWANPNGYGNTSDKTQGFMWLFPLRHKYEKKRIPNDWDCK